jgi:transcriptional regulator GlxA family with amidase domain
VEHATLLLETGSEPLDAVAARVGYADASMLRKLLLRERGVTPGMMRSRRTRTRTA